MFRLLLPCLLATACAARVAQPDWREPRPPLEVVTPVQSSAPVFAPSGPAAVSYRDSGALAPTPLAREIFATVSRAAAQLGQPPLVLDAALSAVAMDLAPLHATVGMPSVELVQFALSHHGLVWPHPHLVVARFSGPDLAPLLARLEADLPGVLRTSRYARVGIGHVEATPGDTTLLIAFQEGGLALDPVARELPPGARTRVRGKLLAPYRAPHVYVTGHDGKFIDVPVTAEGPDGFHAEVACGDGIGKIQVEVAGDDKPESPVVLANFPIWCGVPAPRRTEIGARGVVGDDAGQAEADLLRLANRDRLKAGLAPLTWSEHAATIARAHATEMRDKNYVSHVSPTTGSYADWARAGGLGSPMLLENLARAQSAAEAHLGLMDSPGHRANLLHPQATHLGIGVARTDTRDLFVAQLFYRVPPTRDPADMRREAAAVIAAARVKAGVGAVTADPDLERIAQTFAAGSAAGKDKDGLSRAVDFALDKLPRRYAQVLTVTTVVGEIPDIVGDEVIDGRMRAVGIGVAQGNHKVFGEAAIFVVMMFGRTR